MADPHCRISRVRFKDSGRELCIHDFGAQRRQQKADLIAKMRKAIANTEDDHEDNLEGFALVAWTSSGITYAYYNMRDDGTFMHYTVIPEFVEKVLQHHIAGGG